MRKPLSTFYKPQYSIVKLEGIILSGGELLITAISRSGNRTAIPVNDIAEETLGFLYGFEGSLR